jgi:hypothetical protein
MENEIKNLEKVENYDDQTFGFYYKRRFPNENYPELTIEEQEVKDEEETLVIAYEFCGYPREDIIRYIREVGLSPTLELFATTDEIKEAVENALMNEYLMTEKQSEAFLERFEFIPTLIKFKTDKQLVDKKAFWYLHPVESLHTTIFFVFLSTTLFLVIIGGIALSFLTILRLFSENANILFYELPIIFALSFTALVIAEHKTGYFTTLLDSEIKKIDLSRPIRLLLWTALGILIPVLGVIYFTNSGLGSESWASLLMIISAVVFGCLVDYLLTVRLENIIKNS